MLPAVSQRFQIEELVTQDSVGVLFRAVDWQTGGAVGLRRFFPFGAGGGGLLEKEHAEYGQAVAHLACLKLPGLRSILTGGCDPVDGMPFVATEWIDGPSLAELLEHGHFPPEAAAAVLDRALEICEALSATLAEEAVWVETTPAMIVLDQGTEQRGYTFGICPIRWLVGSGKRRSLMPLVALAEDLLGWRGRHVEEQAGNGLSGWLNWLRADPETITLAEARRALAKLPGDPPPPAPAGPHDEALPADGMAQPAPRRRPRASELRTQLILTGVLLALIAAVAGWAMSRPQGRAAAKLALQAAPVFQATDTTALRVMADREVTMEGVLKTLRWSASRTALWLEFEGASAASGCVTPAGAELSEEALKGLIGQRIRVTGRVSPQPDNAHLPELRITNRQSIQPLP